MGRDFRVRHPVARAQGAAIHSVPSLAYEFPVVDREGQPDISKIGSSEYACGITARSGSPIHDMWLESFQTAR